MHVRSFPGLSLAVCLGAFLFAPSASAASPRDQWPNWRGPLDTGASPAADPPVRWSETENVKWKARIPGRGSSSPIVWDELVFVQTAIPTGKKVAEYPSAIPIATPGAQVQNEPPRRRGGPGGPGGPGRGRTEKPSEAYQFVLLALDRNNGAIRWQQTAREEVPHEGHHPDHGFSSASPVTDGEQVFAYFGSRGLYAYDLAGNLQWSKDFGDMQTKNSFGEGSSPALRGKTLVITWDHEGDDFIVALDKTTGRELWRQPREEETSWATPLILEHEGKAQVVTAATRRIRSYDLETGRLIWECHGLTPNTIPTPVVGDGIVYLTAGFRGNDLLAIRLGKTGDLSESDAIVWRHQRSTPYVPSPLLFNGKLYFISNKNGILSCFDARTGKPHFEAERLEGVREIYASPVGARGRVYLVGRDGTTFVLKESEQLEILASNKLDEGIDASPALAGKQIFLRGREHLYCLAAN